jgi:hypothetical protein
LLHICVTSSQMAGLYSASRILVDQENSSTRLFGLIEAK